MAMSAVIVRKNDDGTVDEVVAKGCSVHLEQMDGSGFYIGIMASDDTYWQFWVGARNGRSLVDLKHTETSPA